MALRDIFVTAVILGLLPAALKRPFIGVLGWHWVSLMNPHRLTWTFARTQPVAMWMAVATFLGLVLYREEKIPIAWNGVTRSFLLLWFWMLVTTFFAVNADRAMGQFVDMSKVFVFLFLTLMLTANRKKLRWLVVVATLSVAFFGIKGGVFTLMTGGGFKVLGPPGTAFGDNNNLALALNLSLPFLFFLPRFVGGKKIKTLLKIAFWLCVIGVLGTHSRGGLVGLAVVFGGLVVLSGRKAILAVALMIGLAALPAIMPDQWFNRMDTIEADSIAQDASFQGRVNSWKTTINFVKDHPIAGGGFQFIYNRDVFNRYSPDPSQFHDVHSIYFEMLGEQGLVGFFIFAVIILSSFRMNSKLRREGIQRQDEMTIGITSAVMVATGVYLVEGIVVARAYFDYFYLILCFPVLLTQILQLPEEQLSRKRQPAEPLAAGLIRNDQRISSL